MFVAKVWHYLRYFWWKFQSYFRNKHGTWFLTVASFWSMLMSWKLLSLQRDIIAFFLYQVSFLLNFCLPLFVSEECEETKTLNFLLTSPFKNVQTLFISVPFLVWRIFWNKRLHHFLILNKKNGKIGSYCYVNIKISVIDCFKLFIIQSIHRCFGSIGSRRV